MLRTGSSMIFYFLCVYVLPVEWCVNRNVKGE